ncbi:HNH endonuclease family protein [Spirosoma areae]
MLDQYDKCCFCEADFTANGYGDVEHFRPKVGFTKTLTGRLIRPGYYWLAYDWNNLFFSCQICNQRLKKNHFPLANEEKRAKNHTADYIQETPLLLHPAMDNPEDHITFNHHVPVDKTERGKISISSFGIDRPTLNRIREAYLQNVRNNEALAGVNLDTITNAKRQQLSQLLNMPWPVIEQLIRTAKIFMATAADDAKPFAAMVRANFPDLA